MIRLVALFACLACVPVRASAEPPNFCLPAAANEREALRRLDPAIPARLLWMQPAHGGLGHAALVYRLRPEGWMVYDDTFGSRQLRRLSWPYATTFPPAWRVARMAFPVSDVGQAWWLTAAPVRSRP